MSSTAPSSAPESSGFSASAWAAASDWFNAITAHPFIRQLADATLPEPLFIGYLVNDAHYLTGYSAALAALAARADADGRVLLAGSAAGAIRAERTLHRGFLLPHGIDPDSGTPDPGSAAEPHPTCRGYLDSLRAAAVLEPVGVGVAAILPCFRVYAEVGGWITDRAESGPDHPYRSWIDTYADPDFADSVRAVERYADRLWSAAGPAERDAMLAAYLGSVRYEWMFWDAAWQQQQWPDPATGRS